MEMREEKGGKTRRTTKKAKMGEEGRRDRQAHRQIDYRSKLADARMHSHTHTFGKTAAHKPLL